MLGVLGLVLEVVRLLGPGLVLGVLGLDLEVVGLLFPRVILGTLGLGLDEVGLFGPGLVCVLLVLAPHAPSLPTLVLIPTPLTLALVLALRLVVEQVPMLED